MPPEKRLEKLKEILKQLDEGLTRDEFVSAFQAVTEYVKSIKNKTDQELELISKALSEAVKRIESSTDNRIQMAKDDLMATVDQTMSKMMLEHEAMIAEAQAKLEEVKNGEDGMDADEEKIVAEVLAKVPPPKELTEQQLRDMLPDLEEIDKLKKELEDLSARLEKRISGFYSAVQGSAGINLTVGGTYRGNSRELAFVGSGVSFTSVNNLPTITITGGAGGSTAVETPTGTVDGSNDTFTVVNTPVYIIVDGIAKFQNVHYTLVGLTITITDGAVPVQFIRSIYSA